MNNNLGESSWEKRNNLVQIYREKLIEIGKEYEGRINPDSNIIHFFNICEYFSCKTIDKFERHGKDLSEITIKVPLKTTIGAKIPLNKKEMFPFNEYVELENGFIIESSEAEKLGINGKVYIPKYENYLVG